MRNFVSSLSTSPARLAGALALVASALVTNPLAAQDTGGQRITGTVTNTTGQPVPDASVSLVGTRLGAITAANGRYAIVGVSPGTFSVRAQRIGFAAATQTVTVSAGQTAVADFQLQAVATVLTEVKVGYTNQAPRTVSDAVATVQASDVKTLASATIEEKLRGRVPGVNVVSSGEPGRPAQVIVRGQNFLGNVSPLYVVDGVYMQENPNLNPDDIETISVLKDASAAAQYGAQAANGVVVITTKHGHGGTPAIGADAFYGYQEVPNQLSLMNTQQWSAIAQQAYANGGVAAPSGVTSPPSVNTNWQDALFQRGAIQNTTVSASGGSDAANYYVAGGYLKQTGAVIRTGFDRYSLRVNTQGSAGKLRVGENMAVSRASYKNMNGFPLIDAVRLLPGISVYDNSTVSGYGFGSASLPTFGTNPIGAQLTEDNTNNSAQLNGNVFAEASILKYLTYRFNFGVGFNDFSARDFRRQAQIRQNSAPDSTELNELRDNNVALLYENQLTFNNQYGPHLINATAAYTEQTQRFNRITAGRRGYVNPDLQTIDVGTQHIQNGGFDSNNALRSMLARVNYTLLDRYIATGSIRRDGSSRFGPGNRYGSFGAASLGWIVSDEGFFGSVPGVRKLDYFKLRASAGRLGNQDFDNYQFDALINNNLNYLFNSQVNPGAINLSLANPEIRWQENQETNVGFDLSALSSALSVQGDYYVSRSKGLLVRAPLPPSSGSASSPYVNAGIVQNTGVELGVTHKYDRAGFGLNTTLTMMTTHNRVVSLGNGSQPIFSGGLGVSRTAVGQAIGEFYVRKATGIFQSAAEVAADCAQPNAQPGDVRYADLNGDCLINDQDRYNAGNSIPKLEGGLFFDSHWGAFDAKLGLHASYGSKIFNAVRFWAERTDENNNHFTDFAPWTPQNHSTTTPRAAFGVAGEQNSVAQSDRYIESGSYLRIQNLEFGYRLPNYIGEFAGLNTGSSRVYVSVQNLHTFTKYRGYDPEVLGAADPLSRGVDDGRIYPNVRTVTLGVSIAP